MKSRATRHTAHTRHEIVARLAAGETLKGICSGGGMPCPESVTGWMRADPEGFGAEVRRARDIAAWRRRTDCDPAVARAILVELGQGRRLEDIVRGPKMPSLRRFMAWRREHAWLAEGYHHAMQARAARRLERVRGRFRAFDPVVAERLYVRLWKGGEPLRRVLASDPAFPSLMVLARWRGEQPEFGSQMNFVLRGWRKKRGRDACLCTPEMTAAIVDGIVHGESLRSLAARPDMPSARAMYNWVRTKPAFAAAVARACVEREHWYLDRIFQIELTATPGMMREVRRRTAPLRKQLTRLRKRPGWKAARAGT